MSEPVVTPALTSLPAVAGRFAKHFRLCHVSVDLGVSVRTVCVPFRCALYTKNCKNDIEAENRDRKLRVNDKNKAISV